MARGHRLDTVRQGPGTRLIGRRLLSDGSAPNGRSDADPSDAQHARVPGDDQ